MTTKLQPRRPARSAFLSSPHAAFWPPLAALVAALAVWGLLPHEQGLALLKEGAAVERLTELLFFALVPAVWWLRRPGDEGRVLLALSVMFLAFGAREMDLHKYWTGTSVLKVSFYLRDAPLHQKLVALPLVAAVLVAAGWLALRFVRPGWRALRRREPLAVTVACFFATMAVSKVFDRSLNILAEDFGVVFPVSVHALVAALEEILELSLPIIAAVGLLQPRWASGR